MKFWDKIVRKQTLGTELKIDVKFGTKKVLLPSFFSGIIIIFHDLKF